MSANGKPSWKDRAEVAEEQVQELEGAVRGLMITIESLKQRCTTLNFDVVDRDTAISMLQAQLNGNVQAEPHGEESLED